MFKELEASVNPEADDFIGYEDSLPMISLCANELTPFQKLRIVQLVTGSLVQKQAYDEIMAVNFAPHQISILIRCYQVVLRPREDHLTIRGLRYLQFTFDEDTLLWSKELDGIAWEDDPESTDFEGIIHVLFGSHVSLAEQTKKRDWERMCARPGSRNFPLDNAISSEYGENKKMLRHWGYSR